MPQIGLGMMEHGKKTEGQEVFIEAALEAGYRHFDCARVYQNEAWIGEAFKKIFSKGKYKREDIFITTKTFPFYHCTAVDTLKDALKDL
jgi:diketogulonate reductase-like aldo/keto reductase